MEDGRVGSARLRERVESTLTEVRGKLDSARDDERALEKQLSEARARISTLEAEEKNVSAVLKTLKKRAPAGGKRHRRRSRPANGERRKELLELLAAEELSRAQLSERLGVSTVRVQQLLAPLIEAGQVESRQDPDYPRPRKLWRAKKSSSPARKPAKRNRRAGAAKPTSAKATAKA